MEKVLNLEKAQDDLKSAELEQNLAHETEINIFNEKRKPSLTRRNERHDKILKIRKDISEAKKEKKFQRRYQREVINQKRMRIEDPNDFPETYAKSEDSDE